MLASASHIQGISDAIVVPPNHVSLVRFSAFRPILFFPGPSRPSVTPRDPRRVQVSFMRAGYIRKLEGMLANC